MIVLARVVGAFGVVLSVMDAVGFTGVIAATARGITRIAAHPPDPSVLSAFIGEIIVAIASLGLYAVIPAATLYVAMVPLRCRDHWFSVALLVCSVYFLVLLPVGTVCGVILLIARHGRRHEFRAHEVPHQTI